MARRIVCLTFDFDAMSGFIARGMTSPTPVSRGEFGANVGAPRILALLKKYKVRTSWYIPGHTLGAPSPSAALVPPGSTRRASRTPNARHGERWPSRPVASMLATDT